MSQVLTPLSAFEYAQSHLINLGYDPAFGEVYQEYLDGIRYVIVPFTLVNEINGETNNYTFYVWIEDGELYGEW
jgi:hypothetical protein